MANTFHLNKSPVYGPKSFLC